MAVMIGIDPHKGSHTAAAVSGAEAVLGELRVRSGSAQLEHLLEWAAQWPERTWAVEGAAGLGYLLSQQLVAAGERVVDVQPKLAARVRLLATSSTNKNDPNDARSVAITALRSPEPKEVQAEDHAAVMKVWAKRRRDLVSSRTQVVCRLHAVLCELAPGGISDRLSSAKAAKMLDELEPDTAIATARHELAVDLLTDLRRLDEQLRETKKRITQVVAASKTTVTEIFGVGPIVAAMVIGYVGDVTRFASSDRFAAYNGTAPIEVSSGPRKIYRLSVAATGVSTTPSTWPPSLRSATCTPRGAPTTTARSPRERPEKRPSARSSGASATRSTASSRSMRNELEQQSSWAREGKQGTTH